MITIRSYCTSLTFLVLAGFILFVIFPCCSNLNKTPTTKVLEPNRNGNIAIGVASLYDTTTGTPCDWALGTIVFEPNYTAAIDKY